MAEATVRGAHAAEDEIECLGGERQPCGLAERGRRLGQRRDQQPVPIGERLVVEPGPDALFPRLQQHGAVLRERGLGRVVGAGDALQAVEDVMAFPIARPLTS